MNPEASDVDRDHEVTALIETLGQTERRLQHLLAGEVDTVTDRAGRTFVLRQTQEHLRDAEAARQAAILNALPAHLALLDTDGVIVSVNQAWQTFAAPSATVAVARTAAPRTSPVSEESPDGTSAATTGWPAALIAPTARAALPVSGRSSPVPKSASTTPSASFRAFENDAAPRVPERGSRAIPASRARRAFACASAR